MKNNQQMTIRFGLVTVLLSYIVFTTNAQNFSAWAIDKAHPTLKARYAMTKDAKGYNFITMEVASTVYCRLQVTSTLCSADKKDKNGWRTITVPPNKPVRVNFKILNSCTNGWWWWYQGYTRSIGGYGNDQELNGY